MVNKKPLIIAAIMGLIAVALVFSYLKKVEQKNATSEIQYGKVVVAKTQIPVRTKVKEAMLDEAIVPTDVINKDAITEIDEVLGKVTNQVIFEGEQILNAKFEDAENLRELAFIIDQGQRAVSIGISDITGLGGNIKPGDHVDVIGVFQAEVTGVDSSVTILDDIMVKAVGASLGPEDQGEDVKDASSARTVTLEVTPQQAEKLVLADEKGSLRLSLRHPDEIYSPKSDGTQIYDFVAWYDPPYRDTNAPAAVTTEPLPKYPEYFNDTPEPEETVEFDFTNFNPVEKIRIEIIAGGEVKEVFLEKPLE